jgi:hypothetical protein
MMQEDDRQNICGCFKARLEDVKRGLNSQLFMDRRWDVAFRHKNQVAGLVKHLSASDWRWYGRVSWTEKLWQFKDLHVVLYQNPDGTLPVAAHVEPDDVRSPFLHGGMKLLGRCRNWSDVNPPGPACADYHVGTILFLNIIQQHLPGLPFELSYRGANVHVVALLRR